MYENEYLDLVSNIINNKEFIKLKKYRHHGITRYQHCINVSYQAYKYAKRHRIDYKDITIAGLLHDFFHINNQELNIFTRIKVIFTHTRLALENAKKITNINKKQENIILSHMFPLGIVFPKYKESWIIVIIDDIVSIKERWQNIFK